jgi:TPR repeat protein
MLESQIQEAEYLIKAYFHSDNTKHKKTIIKLVREILSPLIRIRHPNALWLKASLPNLRKHNLRKLSNEDFENHWRALIKESAEGGCAEAQYTYGCTLYDEGKYVEAVEFYRLSAESGYAPAQWCFGLDTLNGTGVDKNESLAIFYMFVQLNSSINMQLNSYLNAMQKKHTALKTI